MARRSGLVESRMRGNSHVRFGGRAGETGQPGGWYRAPVRPNHGSHLLVAPRFFPSSKRCSGCGVVCAELRLTERVYGCTQCGLRLDRDLNAARNLVWWAEQRLLDAQNVAGSAPETENARGVAERSGMSGDGDGEAGTGVVPEPAGREPAVLSIGLRHVPC
jgi:hypothetical protein